MIEILVRGPSVAFLHFVAIYAKRPEEFKKLD